MAWLNRAGNARPPSNSPLLSHRVIGRSLPRLDLPEKLVGAPFLHDLAPEDVLHARVLRQPRWGARLVRFDEAAVRRAGPVEIVRDGDFVAFVSERESVARAALDRARTTAQWDGGVEIPEDAGTPQDLTALPCVNRTIEVSAGSVPVPKV